GGVLRGLLDLVGRQLFDRTLRGAEQEAEAFLEVFDRLGLLVVAHGCPNDGHSGALFQGAGSVPARKAASMQAIRSARLKGFRSTRAWAVKSVSPVMNTARSEGRNVRISS